MKNNYSRIIYSSLFLLLTVFFFRSIINATPQISLWTGNRCSACHINMQGGGMRNEFGWKFSKEMTTFSIVDEPLATLYSFDKNNYSWFNKLLAFGFDFRYQSTESHKTDAAKRKYYPMQAGFYANTNPFDWLLVEGQFNVGKIGIHDSITYKHNLIYPGQQEWSASAFIKPGQEYPTIRLGKFQPSMGLRDCDMTILDRRFAISDGTEQFIPPDYSEYGAEFIYESYDWLSINLGAYDSWNLSKIRIWGSDLQIIPTQHNPTIALKAAFFPEWLWEDFPAAYLGASALINGNFRYYNIFMGYSIFEDLFVEGKYAGTKLTGKLEDIENQHFTDNFIGQLTWLPYRGVFLSIRAETGYSELSDINSRFYGFRTNQYVGSIKFLPVPFIELIAEYRYLDCLYYSSGRWLFQLHMYY
jgi:hypothetical protein